MSVIRHTAVRRAARVALVVGAALVPAACASKKVSRIDPGTVTDLSGRWNDTDSRLVANELIEQSLNAEWTRRFAETHGGTSPRVVVGSVKNRTLEHIPVNTFVNDLQNAFIRTGAVQVVAGGTERDEVRAEKEDQQQNARSDTRARVGQELGADFMLQGEIQTIEDQEGREKVVYYQIDAVLTDLESNVRVWAGQHKIKKYIERSRLGW